MIGGRTLEERRLGGIETSVDGGNEDVQGSNCASSCRSSNSVGGDLLSDLLQVLVGEDEADITLDIGQQAFIIRKFVQKSTNSTSNHRILSQEDDGLSTERLTDLMHLVGSNIVDARSQHQQ